MRVVVRITYTKLIQKYEITLLIFHQVIFIYISSKNYVIICISIYTQYTIKFSHIGLYCTNLTKMYIINIILKL